MTFHSRPSDAAQTRPLSLGFLTPHNVHDPRAFSGTAYHAARALGGAKGISLKVLGAHHRPLALTDRLPRRLRRAPPGPVAPTPANLAGLDAVVGLVATDLLDRLPPDMPYLHITDATPGYLAEAYGWEIDAMTRAREGRVARRAASCLYSSDMMRRRAMAELGPARAEALPFGVNLDPVAQVDKPPLRPLELLFVGADWQRKGGDIALAALAELRAQGVPARLTLVGRIPQHVAGLPGVTIAGFLDKNRPRHASRLAALYARAHVLVLPTRGDCTPMVIAEAMAHGTPVLATETGAIPEMLGGDGTGRTLPMTAGADHWARAIAGITRNPAQYGFMTDAARDRARTRFSWDAWARGVIRIAGDSLNRSTRAA